MTKHILLVDDDALMRRSLSFNLEQNGFRVNTAANAEDALALARRDAPDLVLLDIGLPGMDGLDALRIFKDKIGVPVIFLTARRRELDEVLGLELGADDYITKPFNLDVVVAHIKAVLRRSQTGGGAQSAVYEFGDLTVNIDRHEATRGGKHLELTPREFRLLGYFLSHQGEVVSREELLDAVWGYDTIPFTRTVDTHIAKLRKKIESDPADPQYLITVHRLGYKFVG